MDMLDEHNLADLSRRFMMRTTRRFGRHVRFTWSRTGGKGEGGIRQFSTPDYIMARENGQSRMRRVGFRAPRYLNSDHRAIAVDIRVGSKGKLKEYRRMRQKFPLSLATGPHDKDTTTFAMLAAECMEPWSNRPKGKDWVREGT